MRSFLTLNSRVLVLHLSGKLTV